MTTTQLKLSGKALARLKEFCSTHEVVVHWFTTTRGASGGAIRTDRTGATKKCRIVPISARESLQLRQAGIQISHRAYFSANPNLDVDYYLRYGTRKLWVKTIRDADELGQMWIADCEERQDGD